MKMLYIFFGLIFTINGCGPTTTGNPIKKQPVSLRMEDTQPFAFMKKASDLLIPSARAAVSNTKFCFKRLRIKADSSSVVSDIELSLGQVDIDPTGTSLLTVQVTEGTYRRVEFDLDKECDGVAGKPSVFFTNGNGTFSTQETMTIKFDGSYTVSAAGTLTLDIDALFDALDLVTADGQIKTSLESAPGDF
jgi:hypothetical protein